jgi:peptidyl-prolyl cis-trans isomerase D
MFPYSSKGVKMLKTMRKHAKYFYFLFFIIIISFIFWGVGTLDKPTAISVVEIDKEKISVEEYWRAYENIRQTYRELFKEQFDEEFEKKLNLKEVVLNTFIEEKVLLIEADKIGVKVTDKELQEAIMNDPRFIRDGVFRKDVYLRVLELNRLTPEMFENSLRQQLTIVKMKQMITSVLDLRLLTEETMDEKFVSELMDGAIKSYVDTAKQKLKIKVNMELIS